MGDPEGETRKYSVDVTVAREARDGFDTLRRRWDEQVGRAIPIPPSKPLGDGDYRISIHHAKVADAVIEDLYSESIVGGTGGDFNHLNDRVVLHVVRRGSWHFARTRDRGKVTVPAGRFIVRHNDPSWEFGIGPRTRSQVLILPSSELRTMIGDRHVTGPADSAELRMLAAHLNAVEETLDDLTPAGVLAARNAMVELVKGVLTHGVDGAEPRLALALARAAKDLADGHLADPDFGPRELARELNVSVRTLQRAFAASEESVAAYIRRRRLERAWRELAVPGRRPGVSELAARWHFADSSHFIRAFKGQYGQTPTQFARSREEGGASSAGSGRGAE